MIVVIYSMDLLSLVFLKSKQNNCLSFEPHDFLIVFAYVYLLESSDLIYYLLSHIDKLRSETGCLCQK